MFRADPFSNTKSTTQIMRFSDMDDIEKTVRVPVHEHKTPSAPTALDKAVYDGLFPYFSPDDNMGLIDSQVFAIANIKAQLEFTQALADELPQNTQIQFTARSVFGLTEGLMRQLDVVSALNDGLCTEIHKYQTEIKALSGGEK